MRQISADQFKITNSTTLKEHSTKIDLQADEDTVKDALKDVRKDLGDWQDTLYAHDKYAVLVCLQGMDTSGKDSLIREVFKDFNVRGVEVHSFKVPTDLERDHDYLWRHYLALPARGKFGIHNRTHYENVLVTRVHPEYILGEQLPNVTSLSDVNDKFWNKRFKQINNFEEHLAENGTLIFKFFLNLSKEEQKHRLLRRLNKKSKNWKFSPGDLKERKLWDNYMDCYEDAINRTSKPHAPWYIIPADDKPTARYLVAKILHDCLTQLDDVVEPELDSEIKAEIDSYKAELNNE